MSTKDVIQALGERNKKVAVAESITGGAVLSELISIPGASAVISGGIVSYQTESKINVLGVPAQVIATSGVISEQTAIEMAVAVRAKFDADIAVATTGVAGPESQDGEPVGLVFIAVASAHGSWVESYLFIGDRAQIRAAAVQAAIALLGKHSGS